MFCRFTIQPSGETILARYVAGSRYDAVLESVGINPDTVLILVHSRFVAQDAKVTSEHAEILLTCTRG